MKKLVLNIILLTFTLIIIIILGLCIFPIRSSLLNSVLEKRLSADVGKEISIGSSRLYLFNRIELKDLKVNKNNPASFVIKEAVVRYKFFPLLRKNLIARCSLKSVTASHPFNDYKIVNSLFNAHGINEIQFDTISANLNVRGESAIIDDVEVMGEKVKLIGKLELEDGDVKAYKLKTYIAKDLLQDVPDNFRGVFFHEDSDGWYTIELNK